MKIITVHTPAFMWNDIPYKVDTYKLPDGDIFTEMQKIVKEQAIKGNTHCFIYNITNSVGEMDSDLAINSPIKPMLVRWKFANIEPDSEIIIRDKMKKIESILRGEQPYIIE